MQVDLCVGAHAALVHRRAAGFLRIGLLVLLVHDISDIPIDFMKVRSVMSYHQHAVLQICFLFLRVLSSQMVNFLKLEGPRGFFLSEIGYAATMIGWVYFRLYQFPFRVIKSATVSKRLLPRPLADADSLCAV